MAHLDEIARDAREAALRCLQLGQVGGRHLRRCDLCRQALELGSHEERLAKLVQREHAHAHAPVGLEADQPQRGEAPQGLAHRGPTDLELLGEVLLAQDAARRDLAGDDRLLEREGEVVGLRAVGHL